MRLIDADELMEHVWRDKLDSRELIAGMIEKAPTVKEITIRIPIDVVENGTLLPSGLNYYNDNDPATQKVRETIMRIKKKKNKKSYDVFAEMDRKKIIAEAREKARILNDFADSLERIDIRYAEIEESEE